MIRARSQESAGLLGLAGDLTPLIDVLFMLIVFMVLTANAANRALDADFATTEETGLPTPDEAEPIEVDVLKTGGPAYRIGGTDYRSWATARQALETRLSDDAAIRIAAAADAPSQRLLDLLAFLQGHGVTDVSIVMHARRP